MPYRNDEEAQEISEINSLRIANAALEERTAKAEKATKRLEWRYKKLIPGIGITLVHLGFSLLLYLFLSFCSSVSWGTAVHAAGQCGKDENAQPFLRGAQFDEFHLWAFVLVMIANMIAVGLRLMDED